MKVSLSMAKQMAKALLQRCKVLSIQVSFFKINLLKEAEFQLIKRLFILANLKIINFQAKEH